MAALTEEYLVGQLVRGVLHPDGTAVNPNSGS